MRFGFDHGRLAGNCDHLFGTADLEFEVELGGRACVHLEFGREFRRHVGSNGARGVLSGRQEFKHKFYLGIAGDEVMKALRRIHKGNGSIDNRVAERISNGPANRSGRGILSHEGWHTEDQQRQQEDAARMACHRTITLQKEVSGEPSLDGRQFLYITGGRAMSVTMQFSFTLGSRLGKRTGGDARPLSNHCDIFRCTNSSTRCSTSSSDKRVESTMVASAAGVSGDAARVRSRWSRSRNSAALDSAAVPRRFCCCNRRCSRTTGSASRKIFTSALGKTLVPMSRPSITMPPPAPSSCWRATIHSRTRG